MIQYNLTPTNVRLTQISEKYKNELGLPPKRDECKRSYSINVSLIKKRLWLVFNFQQTIKHLYFWTITFPEGIQTDVAYIIFNSWLTNMRTRYGLIHYLWVAEYQKNNTIHFHLFICHYINIKKANTALKNAIKTQYKCGKITKAQAESSKNYNGVHISKDSKGKAINLIKVKQKNRRKTIISYITKYVTKASQSNPIGEYHYQWFCSRSFSNLQTDRAISNPEDAILILASNFIDDTYYFQPTPFIYIYPFIDIPQKIPIFDQYLKDNQEYFHQKFIF